MKNNKHDMPKQKMLSMLLIGPCYPPIGGTTVAFSNLINALKKNKKINFIVVNTSRGNEINSPITNVLVAIKTLVATVVLLPKQDLVSIHISFRGAVLFGPILFLLARIYKKPIVYRFFGGEFEQKYKKAQFFIKWIAKKTLLCADCCLFETKKGTEYFKKISSSKVKWFPNFANEIKQKSKRKECKKFVFVGRVTKQKGIDIIIEAAKLLPKRIKIYIIGPLYDYSEKELSNRNGTIKYIGPMNHADIERTLWDYDAMLFPTQSENEGYPSTIIESLNHRLPIIATEWKHSSEILSRDCSIVLKNQTAKGFKDAILMLSENNKYFQRLQAGAIKKAKCFSEKIWIKKFINLCRSVTK